MLDCVTVVLKTMSSRSKSDEDLVDAVMADHAMDTKASPS
jgi:hypothetical protein